MKASEEYRLVAGEVRKARIAVGVGREHLPNGAIELYEVMGDVRALLWDLEQALQADAAAEEARGN